MDPNISLEAAYYQVDRISESRNIDKGTLENLINNNARYYVTSNKILINVLKLNIELDKLSKEI